MSLPTPKLDDRTFQDIVDQVKPMIAKRCPEWTDHNVSDPGVTLIELFAWMTEMLLYRVNQVPDRMYVKFLEMIGVQLQPPRAAVAPVTFYFSAALPHAETIAEGTEVATIRTETSPSTIFTTEKPLTIYPAQLVGALSQPRGGRSGWVTHELRQFEFQGQKIKLFPSDPPEVNDAIYIQLGQDHSRHVLALVLRCDKARGAGIVPDNPPLQWEVSAGSSMWRKCECEFDGTRGFSESGGEIILRVPDMAPDTCNNIEGYWLRCRATQPTPQTGVYEVSPEIESLRIESRGGTVHARHAVTVREELLGYSDGTPGQTFKLKHTPILDLKPYECGKDDNECLIVETTDASDEWQYVADFADSNGSDHHFTLDYLDGTLNLGPALLQPDGKVYSFGATPPKGSKLTFSRYRYGGGLAGNVPTSRLTVLKTSIPYVARVWNWEPSQGGQDAQSIEDAKVRAPGHLRTRAPLVTAENYEHMAVQIPGVARARCISPAAQPGVSGEPEPGRIVVVMLPQIDRVNGRIAPGQLTCPAGLLESVHDQLAARSLLGVRIDVQQPQYIWVSLQATIRPSRGSNSDDLRRRVEAELYRYLNPYIGGPPGTGWPFGRALHLSEIAGRLQQLAGVEFVEDIIATTGSPGSSVGQQQIRSILQLPPSGLICSDVHCVSCPDEAR